MRHVELAYQLMDQRGPEARLHNPLMDTLWAVRREGSISAAARALRLSYRHVWGQLKTWEVQVGQPLIVWERGQAAQLTPFAEKLLWTERLAQARLGGKIEALRADLERTLALAFEPDSHVLSLYASHDDALPMLQRHAAAHAKLHLDIQFCGSVDAIRALNEGRCVLAGFHARQHPAMDSLFARAYRPLLEPGRHKLLGFAKRRQGLIVAPGNPLRLQGLRDLSGLERRYVNRPVGTGTRVLLEELLQAEGLSISDIGTEPRCEPSHAAVAQAVASGQADAGLGTEAAAAAMGLGFVPLVQEQYHLVCLKSALDQPPLQALRQTLASAAWQAELAALPGYTPDASGTVRPLTALLPWWSFGKTTG